MARTAQKLTVTEYKVLIGIENSKKMSNCKTAKQLVERGFIEEGPKVGIRPTRKGCRALTAFEGK